MNQVKRTVARRRLNQIRPTGFNKFKGVDENGKNIPTRRQIKDYHWLLEANGKFGL